MTSDPTQKLLDIMARLRNPEGGCPWDLEQTPESIVPYTIEEAYEVAEAVERGDPAGLKEELGDLLLQVVFQAQMASEAGRFTYEDVVDGIVDKMERRHPHIFGEADIRTAEEQTASWEAIKRQEKGNASASALDGVPAGMAALPRAQKLAGKAMKVGFDWPDAPSVLEKVDEELAELKEAVASGDSKHAEEELGDLLFTLACLARKLGLDGEAALRGANRKFESRFTAMEALSDAPLGGQSLEALEALWQRAKKAGRAA